MNISRGEFYINSFFWGGGGLVQEFLSFFCPNFIILVLFLLLVFLIFGSEYHMGITQIGHLLEYREIELKIVGRQLPCSFWS
jgi:hypothetical protein